MIKFTFLYFRNLEALNDDLQRSIDGLNSEFDQNHQTLIGQIKELNDITNELEYVHKATTVGSLVGSSVGLAGGIAALVGFFLAPFTLGASLALTVGGTVAGLAGGVTGGASNITNMVKQKTLRETIEKITIDFLNRIEPMIKHLNTINTTIEELQKMGIGEAAANATKAFKVVGKLTTAIASLFLFLDFNSIVLDSIEISEMNQSENERKEEEIKSETLKFIHRMRKSATKFQDTVDEIERVRNDINRELQNS
ncbi:hypothetical protein PO909_024911 [Leuciscus waleckii]